MPDGENNCWRRSKWVRRSIRLRCRSAMRFIWPPRTGCTSSRQALILKRVKGPYRRSELDLHAKGSSLVAVPIASSAAPGVKLGKPQVLFTVESRLLNGYDVFPDGQRFLIPEPLEATKPRGIRVGQNWSAAFAPKHSNSQ